jgi:hypothetical protein
MTSILKTNAIEPEGATTTLTLGNAGQNVVIGAECIKNNVMKDAGGNALFTSNGSGTLSGVNSAFGSAQVLLSTTTVSTAVSSISFTSGIDSTYKEYVFDWINIKSATAGSNWYFQVNTSGQTGYDEPTTSTFFRAYNGESGTNGIGYITTDDQGNGTDYQRLIEGGGLESGADASTSGWLELYNPASTTYVKQYLGRSRQMKAGGPWSIDNFVSGYFNVTAAITEIDFKFSSGNISGGIIKMYGIK